MRAVRPWCSSSFILVCGTALWACGGGERSGAAGTDTATSPAGGASTSTTTPAAAPGGASSAATGGAAGTAAPATGNTVDVKMLGDAQGYRFEPANVTVKAGDAVRWTVVSGPPHNVTFWPDSIPQDAASQLGANMPETTTPLTGPLRATVGETYVVSFAGVKPGVFKYYCTPHLALGMKAQITVQ